jgi:hypothetical protein
MFFVQTTNETGEIDTQTKSMDSPCAARWDGSLMATGKMHADELDTDASPSARR